MDKQTVIKMLNMAAIQLANMREVDYEKFVNQAIYWIEQTETVNELRESFPRLARMETAEWTVSY